MSGLLQTVREALTEALTDLDALDRSSLPRCHTNEWNGGGGDQGDFEMQVVRGYRESRHLSEAASMEKLSSF